MQPVTPQTFLIGRTSVVWDGVRDYLDAVGGDSQVWADRVEGVEPDTEALPEFMGRLCYKSWTPGLNANVTKVRENSHEYHQNVLRSGHGSVVEHSNFTFAFHNVSRVFTAELNRHRAGVAISEQSLRFVRLDNLPIWTPEWAKEDPELMERQASLIAAMEEHQLWMADHFGLDDPGVPFSEKKHKTSFMRRMAPMGVATEEGWTANIRTLRHVIYMRTALAAEEEIRIVMDQVAEIMLAELPNIMADYNPNEHREWIPEFLKV